ncbi:MAG: bifunctional methylenetetrahydrofolate dehydrogenase/methenyltetrahydrofolate cyclohydrolase FolD [Faecalibacterium sp.]|jgi:methylenetetrahydrofolate dehydrogenase (NADP+)/methenyltetrahydrofolate cyclohydrolase|nr:bifunctional methylenetetrahydrofolate dehydrogenase/methenyltetrahydrofolate cyclohydrolase FolD [Faecalibacterium sp.]
MAAQIISGKVLAAQIKESVRAEVNTLTAQGIRPCLAVVLAGDNPASATYVRGKQKDCAECGIESKLLHLPAEVTQTELLRVMETLADNKDVHGMLAQLPLPAQIDDQKIIAAIPPEKDVDGFTPVSAGKLLIGEESMLPCTPAGVIAMLKYAGVPLAGKRAVVLGRSNIVGKPASLLLLRENCTVTVCHSKTQGLQDICAEADILVAAIGKAKFVTADMVKPGAAVIDVGINRGEDGKLCGDVDFDAVQQKAGWISPVPGGVGLMTRAMLMVNTLKACKQQNGLA